MIAILSFVLKYTLLLTVHKCFQALLDNFDNHTIYVRKNIIGTIYKGDSSNYSLIKRYSRTKEKKHYEIIEISMVTQMKMLDVQ